MLHLLPSTVKKEKVDSEAGGPGSSSYKRQKDAKNKASSSRYTTQAQLASTYAAASRRESSDLLCPVYL